MGKDNKSSGLKLPQKGVLATPIGYLTHFRQNKEKGSSFLAQAFSWAQDSYLSFMRNKKSFGIFQPKSALEDSESQELPS